MSPEKLYKLAEFLANLTNPKINIAYTRPMPRAGDVAVVNILLNAVKDEIGKGHLERVSQIIKNRFTITPMLEKQLDIIWDLYHPDEAFFAHLETCLSAK